MLVISPELIRAHTNSDELGQLDRVGRVARVSQLGDQLTQPDQLSSARADAIGQGARRDRRDARSSRKPINLFL